MQAVVGSGPNLPVDGGQIKIISIIITNPSLDIVAKNNDGTAAQSEVVRRANIENVKNGKGSISNCLALN